jgi:CheY-like chemotaxis protein
MDFSLESLDLQELSSKDIITWSIQANQFIELIPEPTALIDEQGLICFANSSFYDKIAKIGRLKEKDFTQVIIHTDDRDEVIDCLQEILEKYYSVIHYQTLKNIKTYQYRKNTRYASTIALRKDEVQQHCDDLTDKDYCIYDWTFSSGLGFIVATAREPGQTGISSPSSSTSSFSGKYHTKCDEKPSKLSSSSLSEEIVSSNEIQYRDFIKSIELYSQSCWTHVDIMMNEVRLSRNLLLDVQHNVNNIIGTCVDMRMICHGFDTDLNNREEEEQENINVDQVIQNVLRLYYVGELPRNFSYILECLPRNSNPSTARVSSICTKKAIFERAIFHLIDCFHFYCKSQDNDVIINATIDRESVWNDDNSDENSNKKAIQKEKNQNGENMKYPMKLTIVIKFQHNDDKNIALDHSNILSSISTLHELNSTNIADVLKINCHKSLKFFALIIKCIGGVSHYDRYLDQDILSFELNTYGTVKEIRTTEVITTESHDIRKHTIFEEISVQQEEKLKILIVDDSNLCSRMLAHIVEKLGFDYLIASNGFDAYSMLKDPQNMNKIACVLMDLRMPDMDGIECTKEIKSSELHHIPIIIVSAQASSNIDACLEAGATTVINKPVAIDTLRTELQSILPK